MENNCNLYKKSIFEKIKTEYNKIEEFKNKNDAKKGRFNAKEKDIILLFVCRKTENGGYILDKRLMCLIS